MYSLERYFGYSASDKVFAICPAILYELSKYVVIRAIIELRLQK